MTKQDNEFLVRQRIALRFIYQDGSDFAELCPEIVEDAGTHTCAQIAEHYEVAELFGVTDEMATSIVVRALQELLTAEERKALYAERMHAMHRRAGLDVMERGVGIFGMTPEGRSAVGRRSGAIMGARSRDEGFGLFGIDRKELERRQKEGLRFRKGGWFNENNKIDGMTPAMFVLLLATLDEYRITSGRHVGSPDYTKIHNALSVRYPDFNKSRAATKGFFENARRTMRRTLSDDDAL